MKYTITSERKAYEHVVCRKRETEAEVQSSTLNARLIVLRLSDLGLEIKNDIKLGA